MKKKFTPPEVCPVCGEDVPRNARACPECGADELSGWKDDAYTYDGLGLPDEDFDYDEFVAREFKGPPKPNLRGIWIATAVLLLLVSLLALLRSQ
jgi:hypothetical protein